MVHTENTVNAVTNNRLNGLVEFGFYLDELSKNLKESYYDEKSSLDTHKWVEFIRDDYKQMVSNRMNELTKKNLNIKD
jgi:hypothetical protein